MFDHADPTIQVSAPLPDGSRDLFVSGRRISILCNVPAGSRISYSVVVDGQAYKSGELVAEAPSADVKGSE